MCDRGVYQLKKTATLMIKINIIKLAVIFLVI